MPKIEKHAPGSFCWVEVGTTDRDGAKTFYAALFGWIAVDIPTGPNASYTIFKLADRDAAGAYTMQPEERAMTPPHWNLYVAVDDADATTWRAVELGGKIIAPPFDVLTFGTMAVIQDPTGAIFCIWQPGDHQRTAVKGENGTVCWADLSTPDPERAKQFYEGLFGWKIGAAPQFPPEYLVIENDGGFIGGIPPAVYRKPDTPPYWMPFFLAGDVDGLAAKVKELGGAEYMAPASMGGARLAVLADPQGAAFSIIQPPSRG
jgi:hypothetical protein